MAPTFLTPLIGKRALSNAWIVEPARMTPAVTERLNGALSSTRQISVRVRPALTDPAAFIADEVGRMAGRLIDDARTVGVVRVKMQPGRLDPGSNRHHGHIIESFEVGKTYALSVPAALRLLNCDPYRYIFEEVGDEGEGTAPAGISPDSVMNEILEANRHLRARLEALESSAAARPAASKKRTLKDTLADAEGEES